MRPMAGTSASGATCRGKRCISMRPIDFVLFDGDSSPNIPAHEVFIALQRPIKIFGDSHTEYEVLSYYLHEGFMYLDIERKGE